MRNKEKPITAGQMKALHATLTKAGIEDDDVRIVADVAARKT